MGDSRTRLPEAPADWLTRPLMRFLRIESMAGAVLLFSTLLALVLSNAAWSSQFIAMWEIHAGFRLGDIEFSRSLKSWINDALMTLFFFVIALELKRELVLGELRDRRMAAFPLAAALAAGSLLTGIGFTMALFIAGLAFEPDLLDSVKIGLLSASVSSAAAGFLALAWITSSRR